MYPIRCVPIAHSYQYIVAVACRKLVVIFLLFVSSSGFAQDLFKVHQGWTDLTLWYKLNDKVRVGGDFGYRTRLDNFSFHQVYIRPTVQWRVNPLYTLSFAVSNFRLFNQGTIDLDELRFAQQARINWPQLGKVKINHRIRFEERFFYINNEKADAYRTRYRLAVAPPDFLLFGIGSKFYSRITWEAFINIGGNFDDVLGNSHRWELVFGNKVSDKMRIGLHYFWQTMREVNDLFVLDINVVRLRINYVIN